MKVIATHFFYRSAKPLAKRYKSCNEDYQRLLREIEANPQMGIDLGGGLRKIRMSITSKGRGKSGGCRVITFDAIERNGNLDLVYVFDKADSSSVHTKIMLEYVKALGI